MNWKCNSCGGTYSDTRADGGPYYHACNSEVIEHAQCDETGKVIVPEKRTPREDVRNETPTPGVFFLDGKPHIKQLHPEERGRYVSVPAEYGIISEGKGRTQIE